MTKLNVKNLIKRIDTIYKLNKIIEYYQDKLLAEKCNLSIQDICVHKGDGLYYLTNPPQKKCDKCGAYYCESEK